MKVLVACEFSGVVRDAFTARGHHAVSCDLLPTESPGPHYQGDVRDILGQDWDLMIAHPPCTYLCVSGIHWNTSRPERWEKTREAQAFFHLLFCVNIPKVAIENPVGIHTEACGPPDQYIQPWQFGHGETKKTGLWLRGLPKLIPTEIIPRPAAWERCPDCDEFWCTIHKKHAFECGCPDIDEWEKIGKNPYDLGTGRFDNETPGGQNRLPPKEDRWMERSRTYPGIAKAMAEQWG